MNVTVSIKSFLIILFLSSLLFRIYKISQLPVSLNWDEAAIGYNAYAVLKTGKDEWGNKFPLAFRSFNDYKSPLLVYLTIPFILLFGLNDFAVRLPIVLIGSLTPLAAFFLIRLLFADKKNYKLAFLGGLILAVSPWHIHFTRAAFEASLSLFLVIVGLIFFFSYLKNKKNSLFISVIFLVLSLYAYHAAKIFVPLLVLFLILIYKKDLLKSYKKAVMAVILAVILLLPLLINSIAGQGIKRAEGTIIFSDQFVKEKNQYLFEIQKEAYSQALLSNKRFLIIWNKRPIFLARQFAANYFKHLNPKFLFFSFQGENQRLFIPGASLLYPVELLLIIIGLWQLIKAKNHNQLKAFLFSFLVLSILAPSLSMESPHPLRGIFYLFVLEILTALGLLGIITFINKNKRFMDKAVYIFFAIYLLSFIHFAKVYLTSFPKTSASDWQYGMKQVSEYISENKDDYDEVYIDDFYNNGYIFYLFYSKKLLSLKEIEQHTGKIDNIYFSKDIPSFFSLENQTLLAMQKAENIQENRIRKRIVYPDGDQVFLIYAY